MPRSPRIQFAGAIYHLTARGVERRDLYRDHRDHRRFLRLLGREIGRQRWRCHAYCLMTNHYHLLLETPQPNLSRGMALLNSAYAQWFNSRHDRAGHLFQSRYHSVVLKRQAHLLELCRYIVLNPVRAGMVSSVDDWPWSSYRATVGRIQGPSWLQTGWLLGQFGSNRRSARQAYRRFVRGGARSRSVPSTLPTPSEVLAVVGREFGMPPAAVLGRPRRRAFQTAVHLLCCAANLSQAEVAALAGVSAARISQIHARIEDARSPQPRRLLRLLKKGV